MTYAREKRLLLGVLAFLAPLPLPLNEILTWGAVLLYWLGVILFLHRSMRDRGGWLPPWAMNLLGLVYLPFFLVDLFLFSGGRLVGPVVHLGLFTVLVKLFSLVRERDKWQTLMGIFFLFLASMATSVHPSVVLYLLAFLVFGTLLLSRFAFLHLLAGFGERSPAAPAVPFRGFLVLSVLLACMLAVPLFALLPRVRTPYIHMRGSGAFSGGQTTGFSDEVGLDSIGRVRTSREVALRFRPERDRERWLADRDSLRFKAGTFDVYRDHRWSPTPEHDFLTPQRPRRSFVLDERRPVDWLEVWLQPLGSRTLLLPESTVRVEAPSSTLEVGRGGAVRLSFTPRDVLSYRVGVAAEEVVRHAVPPAVDEPELGPLDPTGLTPAIRELAADVTGGGSPYEQAERLERHLMTSYDYTLDLVGSARGGDPLEAFLFEHRTGHCEYFATSMVLMLRARGIPARLVTGFLGAEHNPLEGYFIVRQSNAHAWVEAWIPERGGWVTFDPTPAVGRPTGGEANVWSLVNQAYDYMLFRWDRYVLSYDFIDQIRIVGRLRDLWLTMTAALGRDAESGAEEASGGGSTAIGLAPSGGVRASWVALSGLLVALAGIGLLLYRRRSMLTATQAYRRLRRQLRREGAVVGDAEGPLAVRRQLTELFPAAAVPATKMFDLYLAESFAGRELAPGEQQMLERSLADTLRAVRGRRREAA